MRIVSLVMRVKPEDLAGARQSLLVIPGVQVHAEDTGTGRMVITVEDGAGYSIADSIIAAHKVPQVLSATLAYEHTEDEPQPSSATPPPCLRAATGVSP